jgi:hypothetical protein
MFAVAESADEAMIAFMDYRPDLVVININVVGSMDGIETSFPLSIWKRPYQNRSSADRR